MRRGAVKANPYLKRPPKIDIQSLPRILRSILIININSRIVNQRSDVSLATLAFHMLRERFDTARIRNIQFRVLNFDVLVLSLQSKVLALPRGSQQSQGRKRWVRENLVAEGQPDAAICAGDYDYWVRHSYCN